MKKRHIFCLAYFIFYTIALILLSLKIHLTNNFLNNFITLGFIFFPLVIIVGISAFKKSLLRNIFLVISSILTVLWFMVTSLALIFTVGNIVTNSNNGFRKVYEKQVNDKTLAIFRTPDSGAFGGDELQAAFVKKVFWGLERREWIESGVSYEYQADSCYVLVDGNKENVPHHDVLYEKGNLNIKNKRKNAVIEDFIMSESKDGGAFDFFTNVKENEYDFTQMKPELFSSYHDFALYKWGRNCSNLGIETVENAYDLYAKIKGEALNENEKLYIKMGFNREWDW